MSEREERPWLGLDYYERFGVPGYPPPATPEPYRKPTYPVVRKTSRRVGNRDWEDVT